MLLEGKNMDLKEYLYQKRMTIKQFSEHMGYSRTHMSQIINGKLKPSRGLAKSIERESNGLIKATELLGEQEGESNG